MSGGRGIFAPGGRAVLIEELRDLRYFVEVARCQSFNIAAARLGVSTATLSKAVGRLEKNYGLPLFVRGSRAIRLSIEGEALMRETEASFDSLEHSLETLRERQQEVAGLVQLSTFTVFARTWLAPALPEFLERHPKVQLALSFHDQQRGLSRDIFDIRITFGEKLDDDKAANVLCDLPLIMVASPSYLAARGAPTDPDDLARHECIDGVTPSGGRVRWCLAERGKATEPLIVTPQGRVVVLDEQATVMELAAQGLGLTIVSEQYAAPLIEEGALIRVMEDYDVTANLPMQGQAIMQYRPRKQLSYAARALVDYLIETMPGVAARPGC
jgi:DNA-binding transcriptional LysR family regulator